MTRRCQRLPPLRGGAAHRFGEDQQLSGTAVTSEAAAAVDEVHAVEQPRAHRVEPKRVVHRLVVQRHDPHRVVFASNSHWTHEPTPRRCSAPNICKPRIKWLVKAAGWLSLTSAY